MNILDKERKLQELESKLTELDNEKLISKIKEEIDHYKQETMTNLNAWDRVLLARHQKRPTACDYIKNIFEDFMELHGDRGYRDDQSIVGGIATLNGKPVTIIAQQKGRTLDDNLVRNFAMPHPEGYRKALRLMKQAEKFNRPIITFIDTPGAYPGLGAEERGQGEAIAKNLLEMSALHVPVIAIVIGEGGSGGALALGVANKVYMLENSIYSILSPEGYATILWKDATLASQAAEVMKLTSYDLDELGIIEGIIKEPIGGAHYDPETTFKKTKEIIENDIKYYQTRTHLEIRESRIKKFREIGFFQRFNYENLGGAKR